MSERCVKMSAVEAFDVTKIVNVGDRLMTVLDGVTVNIPKAQFTILTGESGSGKTSLLHCLAALDRPTDGSIVVDGIEITGFSNDEQVEWRGNNVGYVGQKSDLLAGTVMGSIVDPHLLSGHSIDSGWAAEVFQVLGIGGRDFLAGSPSSLSGGEQQRVAIARALVHRPGMLFADEPTSALDSGLTLEVHELLRSMVDEFGVTVVMVSHDEVSESFADTIYNMQDGRIV